MTQDAENPSFQANIERLEQIVEKLEAEDTPLEEALRLFKEGTLLSRQCKAMLEKAKKEVDEALADELTGEESVDTGRGESLDNEIPF